MPPTRSGGRGRVLPILDAESANPAHGSHALFEACELTSAAITGAVLRAPGIILGLGTRPGPCRN